MAGHGSGTGETRPGPITRGRNRLIAMPPLVAIFAAIGMSLCLNSAALASVGKLHYRTCYSSERDLGCKVPIRPSPRNLDALTPVRDVALSPDGTSLYAAGGGSVSSFKRRAKGSLAFRGCIGDDDGCQGLGDLQSLDAVATSPDGSFVYALAYRGIAVFRRASDGALTYSSCVADGGRFGCSRAKHSSFGNLGDIAVSPSGKSVYVSSHRTITTLKRVSGGRLRYVSCLAADGANGCHSMHAPPGAGGLAISPDGKSVYMTSHLHSFVAEFKRGHKGHLTFKGCIANRAVDGCSESPHRSLNYPQGVDVSPDGRSVYVASVGSSAVTTFGRQANGALSFKDCISERGHLGCRQPRSDPFNDPDDVAVSPDGKSVYVAVIDGSISTFKRKRSGRLASRGCIADHGRFEGDCRRARHKSLKGADTIAMSPDGRSVYVGSARGLTALKRTTSRRGRHR